ncbi:Lsr2 protein [Kribbella steppae]|uniref:Lsr2 protein n=1 Tax=Kribbella steppae TaxID=2512223 RepID=A0A4R2GWU0_9ACTN|nr:histone-like nucleoid-structuring protein Lsr2 [Kribbella steppae]TCO15651.1 Lsr2 protein [Kribbella steppae]
MTFALDGISYEIDLGTRNAAALRRALAAYIEVARPVIPPASLTASEVRGRLASMCGRYASVASRADLLDAWRGR